MTPEQAAEIIHLLMAIKWTGWVLCVPIGMIMGATVFGSDK